MAPVEMAPIGITPIAPTAMAPFELGPVEMTRYGMPPLGVTPYAWETVSSTLLSTLHYDHRDGRALNELGSRDLFVT